MTATPDDTLAAAPECVPARMLNEFVYCPRLAYIEWVQGDFVASYETVDGAYRHRVVDDARGSLPEQVSEDETIHASSVWLSAPDEHLSAKIDLVEGQGGKVTPIDYKRSAPPDGGDGVWDTDRAQLCAQAIVLRANGYECTEGLVYYCSTKQRVTVAFTEQVVAWTRTAVDELRIMATGGEMPPPLLDSAKCVRCSLVGVCLPDEVNLLTGRGQTDEEGIRRLLPARDDALPLYVQQQGARVSKRGEVFEVWADGARRAESRVFETSQIALFGNVQVTTQALATALDHGIPVVFFSSGGWFRGVAGGLGHKNAELRLAQFGVALDEEASLGLARQFVRAKITNSRTILRRNAQTPPRDTLDELGSLARRAESSASAEELLGIEGRAGRIYYGVFTKLFKGRTDGTFVFDFRGRNRRPPLDPVNALLSYAYSLLAKDLAVTAAAVGLDPFVGFYHRPRYGRPALALDLMEEFRPIVADSVVLSLINNGALGGGDFVRRGPAVALTQPGRRRFIAGYEQRLDTLVTHPLFGYRVSYRRIFEVQTRLLARHLTGELAAYPGFTTR